MAQAESAAVPQSTSIVPISSLHPNRGPCTIKARVTGTSGVRAFQNGQGGGKLLKVDLEDDEVHLVVPVQWCAHCVCVCEGMGLCVRIVRLSVPCL